MDKRAPFLDESGVPSVTMKMHSGIRLHSHLLSVFWTLVGRNPPPWQTFPLCLPTLRWVILQLFKHPLPVPVGQITPCQITKKRHYERGSIANYSSELLSQADWGEHWESMYPARRCRLDFVFLSWHDGQQYWMSFIPDQRAINDSNPTAGFASFALYGPGKNK